MKKTNQILMYMILASVLLIGFPFVSAATDSTTGGLGDMFKGLPIIGDMGINGILLVAGVVLLILGISRQGRTRGTGTAFIWMGAIMLVIVMLVPTLLGGPDAKSPFGDIFGGLLGGSKDGGTVQPQSVVINNPPANQPTLSTVCAVEDTTVTLSALNKFTQVAVGGQHAYKINGAPISRVSDAGTFTASPGDVLEILWGNATSGAAYFSDKSSEPVPCKGTVTLSRDLMQNGTMTIEVFNEEGNLIDTAGENETLGISDVVTLSAKLKGQYQRGFPYGGVIVAEFNGTGSTSTIDDVVVDFGGKETNVPSIYAITLGAQARTKAYAVPPIMSNQILSGSVTIDADEANNPLVGGSDVILTFYPYNYFVNEDTGSSYDGPAVEDEDDAQAYGHTTAFTVQVD